MGAPAGGPSARPPRSRESRRPTLSSSLGVSQVRKSHGVAVLVAGALVALAIAALLQESGRRQPRPQPPRSTSPRLHRRDLRGRPGSARGLAVDPAGTLVVSCPPGKGHRPGRPAGTGGNRRRRARAPARARLSPRRPLRGETGRIVRFRYDAKSHATRDPVVMAELPAGAHHWTRESRSVPTARSTSAWGRRATSAARRIAAGPRSCATGPMAPTSGSSPPAFATRWDSRSIPGAAPCGRR